MSRYEYETNVIQAPNSILTLLFLHLSFIEAAGITVCCYDHEHVRLIHFKRRNHSHFIRGLLTVAFLSLVTIQGYRRGAEDEYEDEYYSQDEYEEEGSGYVEEEEPPEGQQEFLQIRERLKEEIRQRALAGASTAGRSSSSHDRRPPPPAK
jgi:hypothetical protein